MGEISFHILFPYICFKIPFLLLAQKGWNRYCCQSACDRSNNQQLCQCNSLPVLDPTTSFALRSKPTALDQPGRGHLNIKRQAGQRKGIPARPLFSSCRPSVSSSYFAFLRNLYPPPATLSIPDSPWRSALSLCKAAFLNRKQTL